MFAIEDHLVYMAVIAIAPWLKKPLAMMLLTSEDT